MPGAGASASRPRTHSPHPDARPVRTQANRPTSRGPSPSQAIRNIGPDFRQLRSGWTPLHDFARAASPAHLPDAAVAYDMLAEILALGPDLEARTPQVSVPKPRAVRPVTGRRERGPGSRPGAVAAAVLLKRKSQHPEERLQRSHGGSQ